MVVILSIKLHLIVSRLFYLLSGDESHHLISYIDLYTSLASILRVRNLKIQKIEV